MMMMMMVMMAMMKRNRKKTIVLLYDLLSIEKNRFSVSKNHCAVNLKYGYETVCRSLASCRVIEPTKDPFPFSLCFPAFIFIMTLLYNVALKHGMRLYVLI